MVDSLYFSLPEINPLLQCFLCQGYLIDPYTLKECMHTFCRTCILLHLEKSSRSSYKCPRCQMILQPSSDISKCLIPDRQLGDLLRALLPSLDTDEILNEKDFYENKPSSSTLPKDLCLKLRLAHNSTPLLPMRFTDTTGCTRVRSTIVQKPSTSTSISRKKTPIAIQIELCQKLIDPTISIKQLPHKFLCVSSTLEISHLRKYLETICQISNPYQVYLFFYDSCLHDKTPLLTIKNLLFPSADRLTLHYAIM